MRIHDVFILDEAVDDLNEGKAFYDLQATGIGDYFWDCLISDIESLMVHTSISCEEVFEKIKKRFGK